MQLRVAHIATEGASYRPVKKSKKQLIHEQALASITERRVINRNAALKKFAGRLQELVTKENQLNLANENKV